MHDTDPYSGADGIAASKDSRQLAMFCHLGALASLVGIPGFIIPLVIWLVKKNEDSYIDYHGKEALNFQISVFLYGLALVIVGSILLFVVVGIFFFLLLIVLSIAALVLAVIAGIKANDGELYRYPFTIRLIS